MPNTNPAMGGGTTKGKSEPYVSIPSGGGMPILLGDPSPLTTQLVLREIQALKELLQTRIYGVEKGIEVAHEDITRFPTDVDKAVGALEKVTALKIAYEHQLADIQIKHIEKQFLWIEQVRIEQKRDTATAVDAALKAAKEAVTEQNASNVLAINKSETATTKSMDQLAGLVKTLGDSLNDKITDVKDRVIVVENIAGHVAALQSSVGSLRSGVDKGEAKSEGKAAGISAYSGWIAFIIMLIGFLIMLYNNVKGG